MKMMDAEEEERLAAELFGDDFAAGAGAIEFRADENFVRREKALAQELRNSQWWKNRRSSGICHYCGERFKPAQLTMDHLIPISRGGRSIKANVVPCCKECNTRKHSMLPMEWEEFLHRNGGGKHLEEPGNE